MNQSASVARVYSDKIYRTIEGEEYSHILVSAIRSVEVRSHIFTIPLENVNRMLDGAELYSRLYI